MAGHTTGGAQRGDLTVCVFHIDAAAGPCAHGGKYCRGVGWDILCLCRQCAWTSGHVHVHIHIFAIRSLLTSAHTVYGTCTCMCVCAFMYSIKVSVIVWNSTPVLLLRFESIYM